MNVRQKTRRNPGDEQIFGDEEAAGLRAEVQGLRELVADLAERVHAQFTTISAHAEIARQQVEFVREEARADLERTRELVIGLIDQTRKDLITTSPAPATTGSLPAPPPPAADQQRIDALGRRVDALTEALNNCFDRQRELADTLAAILDTVLSERSGEPVAGLSAA